MSAAMNNVASKDSRPVMIMAGGTGGHIFPALAVAEALQQRGVPVVWLGSEGGMETRLVPQHDIPMKTLSIKGLRGKGISALLLAPFKLSLAVVQAVRVLLDVKPRSVLGMGGFAAGPGGIAAFIARVPLYVHEQNAIPGMTNRWLAKVATQVMEGFKGAFPAAVKALYLGNPVRGKIVDVPAPEQRFAHRDGRLRLLVVGGSLGALTFNRQVPPALARIAPEHRPEVIHQSGERTLEAAREAYAEAGVEAEVTPFINDMASAYAEADLVIARSGALTVTELEQVGVASILVPYPHAVDDHQTANGQALVKAGAAKMIKDSEFSPETLLPLLEPLLNDRKMLLNMAQAARKLAKPKAAEQVAQVCLGEAVTAESKVLEDMALEDKKR